MRFRAFPERVGPRTLSLERVDNFGTSEQLAKTNWSGVVNFHRMQVNLLMSLRFIFDDD